MKNKIYFIKNVDDYSLKCDNSDVVNITGISGSGKTTLSKEYEKQGYKVISLDKIFFLAKKNSNEDHILQDIAWKDIDIYEKYKNGNLTKKNKNNIQKKYMEKIYENIAKFYISKNEKIVIEGTSIYKYISPFLLKGTLIVKKNSILWCIQKNIDRRNKTIDEAVKMHKKGVVISLILKILKKVKSFPKFISRLFNIVFVNKRKINKFLNKCYRKENEKNILFIISKISNGGAERAAANISDSLIDKGYNVKFVTFSSKKPDYDTKAQIIKIKKLKTKNVVKKIKGLKELRILKKDLKIATTVSFLWKSNLYNVLSKYKDKTIICIRNYMSLTIENEEKFINKYISSKLADRVLCVSKVVEQDQIEKFNVKKEKLDVIYNFIDFEKINALKQERIDEDVYNKIFKNSKVIINIGRIDDQKAQWHLIRVVCEIVKKDKSVKLIIFGRGKLEETLKTLIQNLNMKENIFLMGFDSNPYKYLYNSDVFAFTSFYEGLPNTVLEAMSCNLPVISTDSISGAKEILTLDKTIKKENLLDDVEEIWYGEYGIITPRFDFNNDYLNTDALNKKEEMFKEALEKLLYDKDILNKYKEASKDRITYFSKEKIINEWIKELK